MPERIRADYQALANILQRLNTYHDLSEDLQKKLYFQRETLQQNQWLGMGADQFYAEMDELVLPATHQLNAALYETGLFLQYCIQVLQGAELEAVAALDHEGEATEFSPKDGGLYDINGNPYTKDPDVIFVGGIGTNPDSFLGNMQDIKTIWGADVAGIYNQSEGFFSDAFQAWKDKNDANFGWSNNPAVSALVEQIKNDKDGAIELIGHSQGGAIISAALNRLEADGFDLSHVKVTTFGGFGTDYPQGPQYHHFYHAKDPVPLLANVTDFDLDLGETWRLYSNVTMIDDGTTSSAADDHDLTTYVKNYSSFKASESASQSFIGKALMLGNVAVSWLNPHNTGSYIFDNGLNWVGKRTSNLIF